MLRPSQPRQKGQQLDDRHIDKLTDDELRELVAAETESHVAQLLGLLVDRARRRLLWVGSRESSHDGGRLCVGACFV